MTMIYKGGEIPTSARDLQLFSSHRGSGAAAQEIVRQLKKDITRLHKEAKKISLADGIPAMAKLIGTIYKEGVEKLQIKHSGFGASDTEPNYEIGQALVTAAKVILGREDEYMPELADWL
jgi:hypothetical protein